MCASHTLCSATTEKWKHQTHPLKIKLKVATDKQTLSSFKLSDLLSAARHQTQKPHSQGFFGSFFLQLFSLDLPRRYHKVFVGVLVDTQVFPNDLASSLFFAGGPFKESWGTAQQRWRSAVWSRTDSCADWYAHGSHSLTLMQTTSLARTALSNVFKREPCVCLEAMSMFCKFNLEMR